MAFANAYGGTIAIGITDKTRTIEGVDFETEKLNELLRVPFDYCNPTVKVEIERVPCVDSKGRDNHVLLMHIEASPDVHANQADEAYLRVGDKSKLLKFEERLQLSYDKGERYFEDKMVPDATIAYLETHIQEKTFLGPDGTFVTEEEYPKFVRQACI